MRAARCGSGETWLVLGFPVTPSSGPQIPGDPLLVEVDGAGGLPWASRLPGAARRAGFWSVIPVPERGSWAGQRCVHGSRFPMGFPGDSDGKEPACRAGDTLQSLAREVPLEKGTAAHSGILAWGIPWTEAPGATVHRVTESDATEPLTSSLFHCPNGETSQSGSPHRGLGAQAGTWRVAAPRPRPQHSWFPPHFQPAGVCAAGG